MVVDTMVFAYALLGVEEFRQDATATLERYCQLNDIQTAQPIGGFIP